MLLLVSTDGKVTGFFEASDHDYEKFDAYKWQLWNVENGWYPGGVEDPNLLSQTFTDPQNILMLGEGEAYYDFRDLYQQVSGESASKANTQNLMILGSTAGSLGAIRLAGLASTEAGLLASNPTSYFYSQGYKLTLMADEAVAGLAGFPTGVVFGGGGAMLLDNMASGGGRYAATLLDDASSLGAFGRGVDSNPGQFRFFEVPDTTATLSTRERVLANIEASQQSRPTKNFGLYSAREQQIVSGYAADDWQLGVLKQDSIVYGGVPGQSTFYTDFGTVKNSGLNADSLFKSLQVSPHPVYGYRPQIQAYRVKSDIEVPQGSVLANPDLGPGGGYQYLIKGFDSFLEPIRTFNLKK